MMPSRHGPVSATGCLAAALALGDAFFTAGLEGGEADGFGAEGAWVHPVAVKHDTRMTAATKLRNMVEGTTVDCTGRENYSVRAPSASKAPVVTPISSID